MADEIAALQTSVAPELFKGFDAAPWPATSIPAFGLVSNGYALDDATGEALTFAVRDALFEECLDIADPEVLQSALFKGIRGEVNAYWGRKPNVTVFVHRV